MKKTLRKADATALAPLLIFTIFTACILIVLLFGADIYQKFTRRNQSGYDHRTIAQYISTRVRQSDSDNVPFIGEFDDVSGKNSGDTFFIREQFGGEVYLTRIYCHDGYLYELFTLEGLQFEPEDGEAILPLNSLSFSRSCDLLYVEVEYTDAVRDTLILHLRSQKEVLP